jgi:hypothetical protein
MTRERQTPDKLRLQRHIPSAYSSTNQIHSNSSSYDKLRLQRHIPSASKREGTENEAGLRRGAVSCDPVLEDNGGARRWSRVLREGEKDCVLRAQLPEAPGSLAKSRKMHLLDFKDSGATVITGLPHILPQGPVNTGIPQGCVCVCVCLRVYVLVYVCDACLRLWCLLFVCSRACMQCVRAYP